MKLDKIGKYVNQVDVRNTDGESLLLKGINMKKDCFASVANVHGTDLTKYKVVRPGQFAYNSMHVGRDRLVPIARLEGDDAVIVSPAYTVFKISDNVDLLGQYLMIWFRESDFDRRAWFTTDSSVRGGFSWNSFCNLMIPVPPKSLQTLICLKGLIHQQKEVSRRKSELLKSLK